MIKAVLFDIGGPIDMEIAHEAAIDAALSSALAAEGVSFSYDEWRAAERAAIDSYAPNAYQAMIWHLCGQDTARAMEVWTRFRALREGASSLLEIRPGIEGVLAALRKRGLKLGIAANQPAKMHSKLAAAGLDLLFDHCVMSDEIGFRKPDPRLFLAVCEALNVGPAHAVMVGDRIDNDVSPARMLGMRTVRFKTGRHRLQRPRTWLEVPDVEVETVGALEAALLRLVEGK
ncbi:HAD family hydrolase [Tepidicaulis sp. LMO-SS28]|uniref:HAD family hydrolase n=1 Tax=Tepidicaulis sp. LMO-SS28 TaxID=3447455 RepID=UPI003EDF0BB7